MTHGHGKSTRMPLRPSTPSHPVQCVLTDIQLLILYFPQTRYCVKWKASEGKLIFLTRKYSVSNSKPTLRSLSTALKRSIFPLRRKCTTSAKRFPHRPRHPAWQRIRDSKTVWIAPCPEQLVFPAPLQYLLPMSALRLHRLLSPPTQHIEHMRLDLMSPCHVVVVPHQHMFEIHMATSTSLASSCETMA